LCARRIGSVSSDDKTLIDPWWNIYPIRFDDNIGKFENSRTRRFNIYGTSKYTCVIMPHWFAAMLTLAIATIPWFRWRFSLRTLLLAMTLAALTLGAIVWAAR
jgi:hypothetical protein